MDQIYLSIQGLLAVGVLVGSQTLNLGDDKYMLLIIIVRYIVYFLTIQGFQGVTAVGYDILHKKPRLDARLLQNINWLQLIIYVAYVAVLLSSKNQKLFAEDFPLIFIAFLILEYPEIQTKTVAPVNYGVGMACNFYEGYLMNVIPSDGGNFGGFVQNVHAFESRERVVVPVKKLFIVITKSLYSPPDLQLFNNADRRDLPKLEACSEPVPFELDVDAMFQSLEEVRKDMAGVIRRSYKNSAYKIYRPRGRPVCLVAECATPLHTLHQVIKNRELYGELADVDVEDVRYDFCTTLTKILAKSSECRDKVELVFYDDTDPESNLADVLLDRISQLELNFEELISVRK